MVFGGFPKKIRNKTFYFHTKKKISLFSFLLSFGPRVRFQGQQLIFWQKKIPPKKRKKIPPLFICLKVAQGAQEAPQNFLELSLIGKAKIDQGNPKGPLCGGALSDQSILCIL
jgi:hypothetical protein